MLKTSIINRIEQFRKYLEISQAELCAKIGYAKSAYTNAKLKQTDIAGGTLAKLFNVYPILNIEWVLTGTGEMLKDTPSVKIEDTAEYRALEKKYIACLEQKNIHGEIYTPVSNVELKKEKIK